MDGGASAVEDALPNNSRRTEIETSGERCELVGIWLGEHSGGKAAGASDGQRLDFGEFHERLAGPVVERSDGIERGVNVRGGFNRHGEVEAAEGEGGGFAEPPKPTF